ncbi:MAG: hypothetical protein M1822_006899 [Bathelium mastoideum]|nr:MAG: hypothetical protein M1822_006899 [Bathelium mastoideum]
MASPSQQLLIQRGTQNRRTLPASQYTVGWLCATDEELTVALASLDEAHLSPALSNPGETTYKYGSIIGRHAVHDVVVVRPIATGKTSMVKAVQGLGRENFPNLDRTFFVGVAGALPRPSVEDDPANKIEKGDVVVAYSPNRRGDAVIEYDRISELGEVGSVLKHHTDKTSHALQSAFDIWFKDYEAKETNVEKILQLMLDQNEKFNAPGPDQDLLFYDETKHCGNRDDCSQCEQKAAPYRRRQGKQEPYRKARFYPIKVHRGLILTGDAVVKSSVTRKGIKAKYPAALCVDTESATMMDEFHPLVIRAISDYADSHYGKAWVSYAAAAAAAVAKDIITELQRHPSQFRSIISFSMETKVPEVDFGDKERVTHSIERPALMKEIKDRFLQSNGRRTGPWLRRNLPRKIKTSFFDASTELSLSEAFKSRCRELENAGISHGQQTASPDHVERFKRWLKRQSDSWLLIFDNLDDLEIDLKKYMPQDTLSPIYVLVTSRLEEVTWARREDIVSVQGLTPQEGQALFTNVLGAELQPAQSLALRALLKRVRYVPLIIFLAAKYIKSKSAKNISQRIMEYLSSFNKPATRRGKRLLEDYWPAFEAPLKAIRNDDPKESQAAIELLALFTFIDHQAVSWDVFTKTWVNLKRRHRRKDLTNWTVQHQMKCLDAYEGETSDNPDLDLVDRGFVLLHRYGLINIRYMEEKDSLYSVHPMIRECMKDYLQNESEQQGHRLVCATTLGSSIAWSYSQEDHRYRNHLLPHVMQFLGLRSPGNSPAFKENFVSLPINAYDKIDIGCKFALVLSENGYSRRAKDLLDTLSHVENEVEAFQPPLETHFVNKLPLQKTRLRGLTANCLHEMGGKDREEALAVRLKVLEEYKTMLSTNSHEMLAAKTDYAISLFFTRGVKGAKEARGLHQEVLHDIKSVPVRQEHQKDQLKHLETTSYRLLANCQQSLGNRDEALRMREKVLGLHQQLIPDRDKYKLWEDISEGYRQSGALLKALDGFKQTYSNRTQLLSKNHNATLIAKSNVAVVLRKLELFEHSRKLQSENDNEMTAEYGELHAESATNLTAKINLALCQSQYSEKVLEKLKCLLDEEGTDEEHARTLNSAAECCLTLASDCPDRPRSMQLYDEAIEYRQRIVHIFEQHHGYGPQDLRTLRAKFRLAQTQLTKEPTLDEAFNQLLDVLHMERMIFGDDHFEVQISFLEIAQRCYDKIPKRDAATGSLHDSDKTVSTVEVNSPDLVMSKEQQMEETACDVDQFVKYVRENGFNTLTATYLRKQLTVLRRYVYLKTDGQSDQNAATAAYDYGSALAMAGDVEKSLQLLQRALQIKAELCGDTSNSYLRLMMRVADKIEPFAPKESDDLKKKRDKCLQRKPETEKKLGDIDKFDKIFKQ